MQGDYYLTTHVHMVLGRGLDDEIRKCLHYKEVIVPCFAYYRASFFSFISSASRIQTLERCQTTDPAGCPHFTKAPTSTSIGVAVTTKGRGPEDRCPSMNLNMLQCCLEGMRRKKP